MSIAEKLQTIAENQQNVYNAGYEKGKAEGGDTETAYNNGFDDGKKAEYDEFWDDYQNMGQRNNWMSAFSRWTNNCYKPKYPFSVCKYMTSMYANSTTIVDTLQPIIITEDFQSATTVFQSCQSLKTIRTIHTLENVTYVNWFNSCKALENITFEGVIGNNISFKDSSLLTHDSLMSIINHLGTVTTTQTLTLHADSKAKLTDAEKAIATEKGWTIA